MSIAARFRVLLPLALFGWLAACGSAQQNVHVRRDVESLGAWTRFDPRPLRLVDDVELSAETREAFDLAFRDALADEGLLATAGVGRDVVEAWPVVVAYRLEGGVDQRFLSTNGVAELTVEVRLKDASGKALGVLRAVERDEIRGVLPKVAGPTLLEATAEALAEQLGETVGH